MLYGSILLTDTISVTKSRSELVQLPTLFLILCNPIAFVSTKISAINEYYLVWPNKRDSSDEGAKIHREQEKYADKTEKNNRAEDNEKKTENEVEVRTEPVEWQTDSKRRCIYRQIQTVIKRYQDKIDISVIHTNIYLVLKIQLTKN